MTLGEPKDLPSPDMYGFSSNVDDGWLVSLFLRVAAVATALTALLVFSSERGLRPPVGHENGSSNPVSPAQRASSPAKRILTVETIASSTETDSHKSQLVSFSAKDVPSTGQEDLLCHKQTRRPPPGDPVLPDPPHVVVRGEHHCESFRSRSLRFVEILMPVSLPTSVQRGAGERGTGRVLRERGGAEKHPRDRAQA